MSASPSKRTRISGRYLLTRLLGRGRRSQVWLAVDELSHRLVALKLMAPVASGGANYTRFRQEVLILEELSGAHTVRMHGAGRDGSVAYLVTEALLGRTLKERISKAGPLAAREVLEVALQVLQGLSEAHMLYVTHGELSASNIFMGDTGTIKVIDWGVARLFGREAKLGDFDGPRGDVHGLGRSLYHALTGAEWPGREEQQELVGPLGAAIDACLAERPCDRPTATGALLRFAEALPGGGLPQSIGPSSVGDWS